MSPQTLTKSPTEQYSALCNEHNWLPKRNKTSESAKKTNRLKRLNQDERRDKQYTSNWYDLAMYQRPPTIRQPMDQKQ